jgi:hypothetical protein
MTASGTPVPKAAIDKNSQLLLHEIEIRSSEKRGFVANPSVNPAPDKRHSKAEFRCFVAATPHSGHGSRTVWCNVKPAAGEVLF